MNSESYTPEHRKKNDNTVLLKVVLPVVLLAIGLGSGFAAGVHYQKGQATPPTTNAMAAGDRFQHSDMGGPMHFSGTMGSVTAISASSISVKDQGDGGTKTYVITSSTVVTNSGASAVYSDIAVGDIVLVRSASDTSSDATAIMLNPTYGSGPSYSN